MGRKKMSGAFEEVKADIDAETAAALTADDTAMVVDNDTITAAAANDADTNAETDAEVAGPREYYPTLSAFLSAITATGAETEALTLALTRFVAQVKSEHVFTLRHQARTGTRQPSLRSFLVCDYVRASPELSELFALLDRPSAHYTLIGKTVDAITVCIAQAYHHQLNPTLPHVVIGIARKIVRSYLPVISKLLGLEDTRLIGSALRLMKTMLLISSAMMRELTLKFTWSHRGLLHLPTRAFDTASKHVSDDNKSSAQKQQQWMKLRSECISVILLLLNSHDTDVVTHIVSVKGYVTSILKHLQHDGILVTHSVFMALLGVLNDSIADSVKYGLFSHYVLDQVLKLYENDSTEFTVLANQFIESLLQHIHRQHSWAMQHRTVTAWPYHKNILQRLLQSLHCATNVDHRRHSLYIVKAFPSLFPSYLSSLTMAFEPRLSSRYFTNIAWLLTLLGTDIDDSHLLFLLNDSNTEHHFVQTMMNYILPSSLTKVLLSQSLQHKEPLIRLMACRLAIALIVRFEQVRRIAVSGSTDAAWQQKCREAETEFLGRVPDIQVVFAMRSKLTGASGNNDSNELLLGAILDLLSVYQRVLLSSQSVAATRIDMWKLLTPTQSLMQSYHTQHKLLTLLAHCDTHSRVFTVAAKVQSPSQPLSQFGQLLSVMIAARNDRQHGSEASIIHQSAMRLATKIIFDTKLFGLDPTVSGDSVSVSDSPAPMEIANLLELVTVKSLSYVEHLFAFLTARSSTAAIAANSVDGFSAILSTALAPLYQSPLQGDEKVVSSVIPLLCALLARSMAGHTDSTGKVADYVAAIVSSDSEEQRPKKKVKVDGTEDEDSKPANRNAIRTALLAHPLFSHVQRLAARLRGEAAAAPAVSEVKAPKSAKKSRKSTSTNGGASNHSIGDTMNAALSAVEAGGVTANMIDFQTLAVTAAASPLALPAVAEAVKSDTNAPAIALIASLPVTSLLPAASDIESSPSILPTIAALSSALVTVDRTPLQQILAVRALSFYLCSLGNAIVTANTAKVFVDVAALLHTMMLDDDDESSILAGARINAALAPHSTGQSLADFLLPFNDDHSNLSMSVAVSTLLHSALDALQSSGSLTTTCVAYLDRVTASCTALAQSQSTPDSLTLPRSLALLHEFARYMTEQQLTRITAAFLATPSKSGNKSRKSVSSSSGHNESGEAWLRLLSHYPELAELLFVHQLDAAIRSLTSLSTRAAYKNCVPLDYLTLRLLSNNCDSHSDGLPSLPYEFFVECLARPSLTRMRIVTLALKSSQRFLFVRCFASHLEGSHREDWAPLLAPCLAYLSAVRVMNDSEQPSNHSGAIVTIIAALSSKLLPAIIAHSTDIDQVTVRQIVDTLVVNNWIDIDQRLEFVRTLLTESKGDTGFTLSQVTICQSLLSLTSNTDTEEIISLTPAASSFLLQSLKTLTKLYKVGDESTTALERQLTEIVLELLGQSAYLPVIDTTVHRVSDTYSHSQWSLAPLSASLSLSSLLAVSSSKDLVKILNRFVTGALRSRYQHSQSHQICFLIISLGLISDSRSLVRDAISLAIDSITLSLPSVPSLTSDALDESLSSKQLEGLFTPHNLFDLICTHSHFFQSIAPVSSTTVPVANDSDSGKESGRQPQSKEGLQIAILQSLYLFFVFPLSPAPCPPPSSLLSLLFSLYNSSYAPLDRTLLSLFMLFESSLPEGMASILSTRRRWGMAGKAELERRLFTGDLASVTDARLDEDLTWIYNNFGASQIQRGPFVTASIAKLAPPINSLTIIEKNGATTHTNSQSSFNHYDAAPQLSLHYDPTFLLPFLLDLMKNYSPDIRRLIDIGLLGFAVQCCAHPLLAVRKLAYRFITRCHAQMEIAQQKEEQQKQSNNEKDADNDNGNYQPFVRYTFKEQAEIQYLLTIFKNSISVKYECLPFLIATFLARTLAILLHPQHRLYKPITKFLSLRPTLSMTDVPNYYSMLSSSHPFDWKVQRGFVLRLCVDGAVTQRDFALFARRHVVPMLMTHFESKVADRYTRALVIETLRRIAVMPTALEFAVEGDNDSESGNGGASDTVPQYSGLVTMVKRHSLLVWLRALIQSDVQELSLQTLVPVMELTLTVAHALEQRITATATDSQHPVEVDKSKIDSDSDDDSERESEDAQAGAAMEAVRAVRRLARRRVGIAQDCAILIESIIDRIAPFIRHHITIGSSTSTNQQLHVQLRDTEAVSEKSEDGGSDGSETLGNFHSTAQSSSSTTDLAILSLSLSTMHQLALTNRKAREASGIDSKQPQLFGNDGFSQLLSQSMTDIRLDCQLLLTLVTAVRQLLTKDEQYHLFELVISSQLADRDPSSTLSVVMFVLSSVMEYSSPADGDRQIIRACEWIGRSFTGRDSRSSLLADNRVRSSLLRLTALTNTAQGLDAVTTMLLALAPSSPDISKLSAVERSMLVQDLFVPMTEPRLSRYQSQASEQ